MLHHTPIQVPVPEIYCFGSTYIIQIEFQDGLTAGQKLYKYNHLVRCSARFGKNTEVLEPQAVLEF
jgi:hypothetical protein